MISKEQFIASFTDKDKCKIADKVIGDIYDRSASSLFRLQPSRAAVIMRQAVAVAVLEHQNFAFVRQNTKH